MSRWIRHHHKQGFVYQDEFRTSQVRPLTALFKLTGLQMLFEAPYVFLEEVKTDVPKKARKKRDNTGVEEKKDEKAETKQQKRAERRKQRKEKWRKRRWKRRRRVEEMPCTSPISVPAPIAPAEEKSEESTLLQGQNSDQQKARRSQAVFALKACSQKQVLALFGRTSAIIVNRDHNAAKNILHCGLRALRQEPQLTMFQRALQKPAITAGQ